MIYILVVLFFLFLICMFYYFSSHWLYGDNIGNQLVLYFMKWYDCLYHGYNYYPKIISKNKILKKLPTSQYVKECSSYSYLNITPMKNQVTAWSNEHGFQIFKKINKLVHQTMEKIILKQNKQNKKIYDVVIHLRCSDSPFNKHVDYHLLKYSWYIKALNIISRKLGKYTKDLRIGILFNPYHQTNCSEQTKNRRIKSAKEYYYYFRQELEKYVNVIDLDSGTVEEDFALMYRSRSLIAAKSSMSFMAGVGSNNITIYPNNSKINIREGFIMLEPEILKHDKVKTYHDVKRVHELL